MQLDCLGYTPLLVISKADAVCAKFAADTLGIHPELERLKHRVIQNLRTATYVLHHAPALPVMITNMI